MEESPKESLNNLIQSIREYVEAKIEITKLQLADKAGSSVGGIITFIVMTILASLILIFASIAVAFLISEYYGKGYIGFAIVAAFYLLIAIIVYAGRDKLINRPVTDSFIKKMFSDEDEEENS